MTERLLPTPRLGGPADAVLADLPPTSLAVAQAAALGRALVGIRALDRDFAAAAVGPLQFGTGPEAMDLAWWVDGKHRELAAVIAGLRAETEALWAQYVARNSAGTAHEPGGEGRD